MNELNWYDDEEEINEINMNALLDSFESKEFKQLISEEHKPIYNDQQQIYVDCLNKLQVGTLWQGRVKGWRYTKDEQKKFGYYVDVGGFDVLCPMRPNEIVEIDDKISVIVTKNWDNKVNAIRTENLPRITWEKTYIKMEIYSWEKLQNIYIPLKYYKCEDIERAKIKQFVKDIAQSSDQLVGNVFYHLQFSLIGGFVVNPQFEPPLLNPELYKLQSYDTQEDIDPNNPNLKVSEHGRVTSQIYTQLPFYASSSDVKQHGLKVLV